MESLTEKIPCALVSEVNLWEGGITFHTLALLVSGAFSVVATVISIFLIVFHATHYSQPGEQRQYVPLVVSHSEKFYLMTCDVFRSISTASSAFFS